MEIKSYILENYENIIINETFVLANEIRDDICINFKISKQKLNILLTDNKSIFEYKTKRIQNKKVYYLTLLNRTDNLENKTVGQNSNTQNKNSEDSNGNTPLDAAILKKHLDIENLIIKAQRKIEFNIFKQTTFYYDLPHVVQEQIQNIFQTLRS